MRIYERFYRFNNGDFSLEDQPRSDRSSTSRTDEYVEEIQEVINADRRWTIDEVTKLTEVL